MNQLLEIVKIAGPYGAFVAMFLFYLYKTRGQKMGSSGLGSKPTFDNFKKFEETAIDYGKLSQQVTEIKDELKDHKRQNSKAEDKSERAYEKFESKMDKKFDKVELGQKELNEKVDRLMQLMVTLTKGVASK